MGALSANPFCSRDREFRAQLRLRSSGWRLEGMYWSGWTNGRLLHLSEDQNKMRRHGSFPCHAWSYLAFFLAEQKTTAACPGEQWLWGEPWPKEHSLDQRAAEFLANSPKPSEILPLLESKVYQSETNNLTFYSWFRNCFLQRQESEIQGLGTWPTDVWYSQSVNTGKKKRNYWKTVSGYSEMSMVRKVDAKIKNSSLHLFSFL